ncbi:MAG TPA: hypothetical protein VK400_16170 [Pyrinomonadaceae bacterium]|nr:hypothetical protein [Pyrinomonadaceae bacterium]
MSEFTSGIVSQIFRQTLENQTQKQQQPQTGGKRTFESYMQEMQESQQQSGQQTNQTERTSPTGATTTQSRTSGVEMQSKLEQMQAELAQRFGQNPADKSKINMMLPELLDSKTRLGMLKEAYGKVGNTSRATGDFAGRFTQVENEFKQVEAIMRSDKNLSPGELLALQARLYQVSQHIEVLSKVVDQMAGGIKTVLNTNV